MMIMAPNIGRQRRTTTWAASDELASLTHTCL
jgi:hypothetical protein